MISKSNGATFLKTGYPRLSILGGLAAGMTGAMLVSLWIYDELSIRRNSVVFSNTSCTKKGCFSVMMKRQIKSFGQRTRQGNVGCS